MVLTDWDEANEDNISESRDAQGREALPALRGVGKNRLPPVSGSVVSSWGTPSEGVSKISAGESKTTLANYDHDEEHSDYSVEEELSNHAESDCNESSGPKKLPNGNSAEMNDTKWSNQDEDQYDNDFSIESSTENFPSKTPAGITDFGCDPPVNKEVNEEDEYGQDDFEFEEDTKSFIVDGKDDDLADSLSFGHKSTVSILYISCFLCKLRCSVIRWKLRVRWALSKYV